MVDIKRHPHYSFYCRIFKLSILIRKQNEQMSIHHTKFDNTFVNKDDALNLLREYINYMMHIEIRDS
jgi:hypothetical protein